MIVLFDLDDTLVTHSTAEREAATRLRETRPEFDRFSATSFEERWRQLSRKHYRRYLAGAMSFHDQRRARVRELLGRAVSDELADRVFRDYLRFYEAAWTLFDDVLPCLESLGGLLLGVVSNGDSGQQRRKLVSTGIAPFFSIILTSSECGAAKPDHKLFQCACRLASCSTSEAVYIGDDLDDDALAATAAGLNGVWLNRGQRPVPESATAVDSLARLPDLVTATAQGAA
jgi:putative hydrolase of the HAD superfamily